MEGALAILSLLRAGLELESGTSFAAEARPQRRSFAPEARSGPVHAAGMLVALALKRHAAGPTRLMVAGVFASAEVSGPPWGMGEVALAAALDRTPGWDGFATAPEAWGRASPAPSYGVARASVPRRPDERRDEIDLRRRVVRFHASVRNGMWEHVRFANIPCASCEGGSTWRYIPARRRPGAASVACLKRACASVCERARACTS